MPDSRAGSWQADQKNIDIIAGKVLTVGSFMENDDQAELQELKILELVGEW